MRKTLLLSVIFAFVMCMACPAFAMDLEKSVDKFADGTMEVIKSPMALHDHTKAEMDDADHKAMGLMKGLLMSPFHIVDKAGHGMLDMATFPIE